MLGLTFLLDSLGVRIKPDEIEAAWDQAKDALPRIDKAFQELVANQRECKETLEYLKEGQDAILLYLESSGKPLITRDDLNSPPRVHEPGACWCGVAHVAAYPFVAESLT